MAWQGKFMKLISLNIWGGRGGREDLLDFFEKYKKDIDFFCLQEVWHEGPDLSGKLAGGSLMGGEMRNAFKEIGNILPWHDGYFKPHFREWYGLATFLKKDMTILEEGNVFVYKHKEYDPDGDDIGNHARNIQYATIQFPDGPKTVINFHGLWNGQGKGDSEERLVQSDRIIQFIKGLSNPFLIAGDFNLSPATESLKRLEDFGLRNLVKEYGITSTRTSHYTKPEKFADYILVREGMKIHEFKILPDEVSDHFSMYLDFS